MWCHWCRKANHEDAQCFSTRPADWRPKPDDTEPVPRDREVARVLLEALHDAPRDTFAWRSLHR